MKSLPKETSGSASHASPSLSMGSFLKTQGNVWQIRVAIGAVLLGSIFLFKFLLDSQPSLIPADFRIGLNSPAQAVTTNSSSTGACTQGCCNPTSDDSNRLPPAVFPNSYLPCKDYIKPGSSTYDLGNISRYFKTEVEDSELLHAAQDVATQPLPPGKPKIAFLFVVRQKIPLEHMWERFFAEADEEAYSIYTHASWWGTVDEFPKTSPFHNRSIPTKEVYRFTIKLVDAHRRLMAFALLDTARANMWFVLMSETCMPVRSFPYVYNYFMNSTTSFVEAFSTVERFKTWETEPVFRKQSTRKGELWMSMHRRHAGMVVGDVTFYRKFKLDCKGDCVLDEQYTQTLLHVRDPQGIANRSITFADWHYHHLGSPRRHTAAWINSTLFEKIQSRTENLDGQYYDSSDDSNHTIWKDCVYNGRSHSPCYLFARKFSNDTEDVQALLNIPKSVLGF